MIDGIRIETDDDGFHLEIDGDLVEEVERYTADADSFTLRLQLPQHAAVELLKTVKENIEPWWQEGENVRLEVLATRGLAREDVPDDGHRYDDEAELLREQADNDRKARRERGDA